MNVYEFIIQTSALTVAQRIRRKLLQNFNQSIHGSNPQLKTQFFSLLCAFCFFDHRYLNYARIEMYMKFKACVYRIQLLWCCYMIDDVCCENGVFASVGAAGVRCAGLTVPTRCLPTRSVHCPATRSSHR